MSRFRSYGYSRGSRTHLSRRDEYFLTDEEKQATYERRKAAALSAKQAGVGRPLMPYRPAEPIDWEKVHAAQETQSPAAIQAQAQVVLEQLAPQTIDMFASVVDEEDDEVGEAPAP